MNHLPAGTLTWLTWLTTLATLWASTLTIAESRASRASREVNTERSVVDRLALENLKSLLSGRNISEVSVSESSWLTSATVNGNTDVNNVLDVAEQLVEIGIGHLKSEVADEQSLGWGVLLAGLLGVGHVVDDHAAAGEEGVVEVLNGLGGGLNVLELDVSESDFHVSLLFCAVDAGVAKHTPWKDHVGPVQF